MTLVLVRHGESEWNAKGLFCGWVDVDLSLKSATVDSHRASKLIKEYSINYKDNIEPLFDICYCSVLKRSIKTAHNILENIDELYIPIKKSWRLNERFYGGLTGQKKIEMVEKYGKEQIKKWRRSYDDPPPEINEDNPLNPKKHDSKYYRLPDFDVNKDFPKTESLFHVIERIKPLWFNEIKPLLKQQKNVFLSIHGTSMRAIIVLIEQEYSSGNNQSDNNDDVNELNHILSKLEIPNGYPVIYEFDKNGAIKIIKDNDDNHDWISKQQKVFKMNVKIHGRFLGNLDDLLNAQNKVKNQIEKDPTDNKKISLL
eukprot:CAMPEP_0201581892 /NCGR_PEP_ID=MMETSP0190_2-20130828/76875_1 /ASSEMBLY_ACC=CAM_ASM_000263 /TAXON_ID=37353 /ORGANISM="Rosalina sp." /LENGTH=312 /DNA_ID=CAMNT_0048020751 /DNA_START=28 /DNA_END=966 /DNA_ORIENTATION=+